MWLWFIKILKKVRQCERRENDREVHFWGGIDFDVGGCVKEEVRELTPSPCRPQKPWPDIPVRSYCFLLSPHSKNKCPQIQQRHIGEWICVPHVLRSYTGTLQRVSLSAKVTVGSVWRPLYCHCRQMGYMPIVHMIQSSYTLRIYNWSTNSTTKSGCVGGSILRILVYLAWHFCCPYSEDRQQLKNSPHSNKHALCLKLCMDI